MELLLKDGDYLPDGMGGMVRLENEQALLQRVLYRLTARRGGFPFLPELGSDLWRLGQEKPGQRLAAARQFVAQALKEEPVEVTEVTLLETPDGCGEVTVSLAYHGEAFSVSATI